MLAALCVALSACAPLVEDVPQPQTYRVCATFYPLYALTALAADGISQIELSCLTDPQDGCLRSYSLSDRDLYALWQADLVVAGGRGLESFETTLQALGDDGPAVALTLYNTELYNQEDTTETGEDAGHLAGANPHLYLSVAGAKYILEGAALSMAQLFPEIADSILENMDAADARLEALGGEMARIAAGAAGGRVILMQEALVYLAQDLSLEIAGQFERESGEMVYENEMEDCLEALSAMEARVILIERQAPAVLVEKLRQAGYAVALIDVLSTGREDMGAEGYFRAQLANAEAIAAAFAQAGEGN